MYARNSQKANLEPYQLEHELAESIFMQGGAFTGGVSHALAESGVKLVIDDLGIGYSSLVICASFRLIP